MTHLGMPQSVCVPNAYRPENNGRVWFPYKVMLNYAIKLLLVRLVNRF